MEKHRKNEFLGEHGERMTTHVSSSGATVYMNREAILLLIEELKRIAEEKPQECFELHFNRYFSYFDNQHNYISPKVKYANGIEEFFQNEFESIMQKEIASGNNVEGLSRAPFEVTIMHVSDQALMEDGLKDDPIEGPVSWELYADRKCS